MQICKHSSWRPRPRRAASDCPDLSSFTFSDFSHPLGEKCWSWINGQNHFNGISKVFMIAKEWASLFSFILCNFLGSVLHTILERWCFLCPVKSSYSYVYLCSNFTCCLGGEVRAFVFGSTSSHGNT